MSVTADSIWSNCLKFIKDNIQPQAFKTWFEPIKAVKLAEGVKAPNVNLKQKMKTQIDNDKLEIYKNSDENLL